LPPSGDRSKAVMVMVIVRTPDENRRLWAWQAVKANSTRLKTIPLNVQFVPHSCDDNVDNCNSGHKRTLQNRASFRPCKGSVVRR
jgi:hypothetical protein